MTSYRAETLGATLLAPHTGKPSEVRPLVRALFQADAHSRPDGTAGTFAVKLPHMAISAREDAGAALYEDLNRSATLRTGTSLKLVYEIPLSQPPT